MEDWKKFEIECRNHLQREYSNNDITFNVEGGYNSYSSDIQVIRDNNCFLSIECKKNPAQCGQFVLSVDNVNKKFIYSPKNKTPLNDSSIKIVEEMEEHFDECCVATTKDIPISEGAISQWVKNYYQNTKQSKYCITNGDGEFIIIPIDKLDEYFTFSAKYRVKKSGSARPSKKNIDELNKLLESLNVNTSIFFCEKECYAKFNYSQDEFVISGEKYRYKFSKDGDVYKIRRLSNTKNANFIVTIRLKKFKQDNQDLIAFKKDLSKTM
jgi:hypothetical protein